MVTEEEGYSADLETKMHQTIKKVSGDFESLKYNTAANLAVHLYAYLHGALHGLGLVIRRPRGLIDSALKESIR